MRAGGMNQGYKKVIQIGQASVTATGLNRIAFDKTPTDVDGYEAGVTGLILRLTPTTIPLIATSGLLDGVGLSQLFAACTLSLSIDSPPGAQGDHQLWTGVDGYRLFTALAALSGRNCIKGSGNYNDTPPLLYAGAGSALNFASGQALPTGARIGSAVGEVVGGTWLHNAGAYGINNTAGTLNWVDTPVFYFPFTSRGGDPRAEAIPLRWLSGVTRDNSRLSAGELTWQYGTTVDNQAVTIGAGTAFLYAVCLVHDGSISQVPAVPFVRVTNQTGSAFRFRRGNHVLSGVMKGLTAPGDMQPIDMTSIDMRLKGVNVIATMAVDHQEMLNLDLDITRRGFSEPTMTANNTGPISSTSVSFATYKYRNAAAPSARYMNVGVWLAKNLGRRDFSQGSTSDELDVIVNTSGEAAFPTLESGWAPIQAGSDYAKRALRFTARPGQVARVLTQKKGGVEQGNAQAQYHGAVIHVADEGTPRAQRILQASNGKAK